jgi:hypothetical protein
MSTLHKVGREFSQCRGRLRSNARAVRNHVQEITPESSATRKLGRKDFFSAQTDSRHSKLLGCSEFYASKSWFGQQRVHLAPTRSLSSKPGRDRSKSSDPLGASDVVSGFVFAGTDARLVLLLCFLDEFLSGHRTHGIGVGVRAD